MLEEFLKFSQRQKLFTRNQKVLIGVSGGIDSVVLCELFHQANVSFGIAHCNFHLRGGESDADELFVSTLAMKYDAPFFRNDFETESYAQEKGVSIQMAARELRYNWFENLRRAKGYDYIAIGNQLNDDIETVIINLTRGTGLRGVTGIPVKNRNVIRPMLFASRTRIAEFAKENEIQWREDSSNQSDKYFRNDIRNNVIPLLKKYNPSLETTFSENIERFNQVQDLLDQQVARAIDVCITRNGKTTELSIEKIKQFKPVKLFLREILLPFNFNANHVENIITLLEGVPGKQFFSDTHCITIDRNTIFIEPIVNDKLENNTLVNSDSTRIEIPLHLNFKKQAIEDFELSKDSKIAQLDFDKLEFPLVLRKWQPGDSFYPLGMENRKKLSDFFVDMKLPLNKKQETYVLISGEDIVWVVGHRIDNRYSLTENTQKVYIVK